MKQEIVWCGTDRYADVPSKPDRVWRVPAPPDRKPALPMTPVFGVNAFPEQLGHDWKMWRGRLRYSPGGIDFQGAWLLCEWDE